MAQYVSGKKWSIGGGRGCVCRTAKTVGVNMANDNWISQYFKPFEPGELKQSNFGTNSIEERQKTKTTFSTLHFIVLVRATIGRTRGWNWGDGRWWNYQRWKGGQMDAMKLLTVLCFYIFKIFLSSSQGGCARYAGGPFSSFSRCSHSSGNSNLTIIDDNEEI